MLKPRITKIIDEFFAIGGTHDLDKYKKIRDRLLEVLREEDFLLGDQDDENVVFVRDVIRYIDAISIYAREMNNRGVHRHINPFFNRLKHSSNWHYYDLALLVSSIQLTESIEQATQLASKAQGHVTLFKHARNVDIVEGCLSLNMCARLLNAKYFDYRVEISLTTEFDKWYKKLEELVKHNALLELPFLVTKIRQNVLNGSEQKVIEQLCDELVQHDKQIGDMLRNEVQFYFEREKMKKKRGETS